MYKRYRATEWNVDELNLHEGDRQSGMCWPSRHADGQLERNKPTIGSRTHMMDQVVAVPRVVRATTNATAIPLSLWLF